MSPLGGDPMRGFPPLKHPDQGTAPLDRFTTETATAGLLCNPPGPGQNMLPNRRTHPIIRSVEARISITRLAFMRRRQKSVEPGSRSHTE